MSAVKREKEGGFLRRMSSKLGGGTKQVKPVTVMEDSPSFIGDTVHAENQTEVAHRTTTVATDSIETRTVGVLTDVMSRIDRDSGTDRAGMWDRAVSCVPFMKEQGVDVGEWNTRIFRGVEAQTDAPELDDPLFWCTGNVRDLRRFTSSLLKRIRDEFLENQFIDEAELTSTQLKADNMMLKLEVEELKARLRKASALESEAAVCRTFTSNRHNIGGLIETGFPKAIRYVVVAEEGVLVTSSLAPSSFVLGKIRKGDKVLSAGSPEILLDKVRVPVLPRGWVTVKDKNAILLEGVSMQ